MNEWRRTNAPIASSRTDDIWFTDPQRGWAVNSNGHVLHTTDGGQAWRRQLSARGQAYLRCVAFATESRGWVGVLEDPARRLFETEDGGATWSVVTSVAALREAPPAICGLSVVDERVVYGSGTNEPSLPTGVIKTVDGGRTWTAQSMDAHATLLVDVLFPDADHGWVVGGKAPPDVARPKRRDVTPVVLFTEDGGASWRNLVEGLDLPKGEWGWKLHFVDEQVGYVSLENFSAGAVLKTTDGGMTWERRAITDPQGNANVEGVGFADRDLGWVGGWGTADFSGGFTSETRDGGRTWVDANHVGKFLNRFRFFREPELVGYASGDTVYKYSEAAVPTEREAGPRLLAAEAAVAPEEPLRTSFPVRIPLAPPAGARSVRVDVWDRFGRHVATPLDEPEGAAAVAEATWEGEEADGPGYYIFRVSIDDDDESGTLLVEP
ncbi:MAG TPA: YCF48-related protein [Solirubrobacteraceae bacterium]|jgi:photosystem II stability/assembly factor-like uncharacterized protein